MTYISHTCVLAARNEYTILLNLEYGVPTIAPIVLLSRDMSPVSKDNRYSLIRYNGYMVKERCVSRLCLL